MFYLQYYGQSEAAVKYIFQLAEESAPACIVIGILNLLAF